VGASVVVVKEFALEVWGDWACFTRPELKVERFSYPVITPSAARAIFDAIYIQFDNGSPKRATFRWEVFRVEVLTPVNYISLSRNEIRGKIDLKNVVGWMQHPESFQPLIVDATDKKSAMSGRDQRQTIALRKVRYRLFARAILYNEDAERRGVIEQIFERRARVGQCRRQPYFGCSEFVCYFELFTGSQGDGIAMKEDLGLMLYDVFDLSRPGSSHDSQSISLFRARLEHGVLQIPAYASDAVFKTGVEAL
jgi:CRISPR-associated protein Cas5d